MSSFIYFFAFALKFTGEESKFSNEHKFAIKIFHLKQTTFLKSFFNRTDKQKRSTWLFNVSFTTKILYTEQNVHSKQSKQNKNGAKMRWSVVFEVRENERIALKHLSYDIFSSFSLISCSQQTIQLAFTFKENSRRKIFIVIMTWILTLWKLNNNHFS